MRDEELAWRIEEVCFSGCPSPRQALHEGWLLRLSGGATRRTNSANPLKGASESGDVIDFARACYRAQGRPTLFRIPSIADALESRLQGEGFVAEGDSRTLLTELAGAAPPNDAIELSAAPSAEWLAARRRMAPLPDDDWAIYREMLGLIALPAAFAAARVESALASVAYGVVHGEWMVVESVVTDPRWRGRGLARRTIGALMAWAHRAGARRACLQVAADNTAGLALYRALGFGRELYTYRYWREPVHLGRFLVESAPRGAGFDCPDRTPDRSDPPF